MAKIVYHGGILIVTRGNSDCAGIDHGTIRVNKVEVIDYYITLLHSNISIRSQTNQPPVFLLVQ